MAFGLTAFAGLATGVGSAIAFFARRANYRFLSVATGFSAGVMLYVSFVEIFVKGVAALGPVYGETRAHWINAASFFVGILLIGIIDSLIPPAENPHVTHSESESAPLRDRSHSPPTSAGAATQGNAGLPESVHDHGRHRKLLRMGLFTALAIAIHNFPEGLATFLAALDDPKVGGAIAVAIALHNIPEGVSVSVPIFYATGSRGKAFAWSLLSGLAEPVGAAAAYGVLCLFTGGGASGGVPPLLMGALFGGVAGIMVYISLDELLPTSRAYGKGHDSLFGLVGGMAVMAVSLLLMK
jgi:ZIP family zinc transporter